MYSINIKFILRNEYPNARNPTHYNLPIGLNNYSTRETMVFDNYAPTNSRLVLHKGSDQEVSYARTAHSEGEMFGLSKYNMGHVDDRVAFLRCS